MSWEITANHQRFDEAVDAFRARVPYTWDQYGQLDDKARANAFWLAGGVELSAVQTVFDEIGRSLENGTGLDEFKKAIRAKLGDMFGASGHHLETVFRNATQTSYNTARWYQLTDGDIAIGRPFLLYDAILDGRTTHTCKTLNGTVKEVKDPFWLSHWPPLHHRCRSSPRSLTRSEANKRGISVGDPGVQVPKGFGLAPPVRGEAPPKPDLAKVDPAVSAAYKEREAQMQRDLAEAQRKAEAARQKQDPKHWFETTYRDLYGEDGGRAVAWGRAMEERGKAVGYDEALRQHKLLTDDLGITTSTNQQGTLSDRIAYGVASGAIPKGVKTWGEVVDALGSAVAKDPADAFLQEVHAETRAVAALIGHRTSIKPGQSVQIQAFKVPKAAPQALHDRHPRIMKQITEFWTQLADDALVLPDVRTGYKIRWLYRRGRFNGDTKQLEVGFEYDAKGTLTKDGHKTAIHEMGHGVEYHNPRAKRAAEEFLKRRTVGERLRRLRDLYPRDGYPASEVTRPDKFPHGYMGKDYINRRTGERYGTEITSVALEYLFEHTTKLVQSDQESFWLALGQLAGEKVAE